MARGGPSRSSFRTSVLNYLSGYVGLTRENIVAQLDAVTRHERGATAAGRTARRPPSLARVKLIRYPAGAGGGRRPQSAFGVVVFTLHFIVLACERRPDGDRRRSDSRSPGARRGRDAPNPFPEIGRETAAKRAPPRRPAGREQPAAVGERGRPPPAGCCRLFASAEFFDERALLGAASKITKTISKIYEAYYGAHKNRKMINSPRVLARAPARRPPPAPDLFGPRFLSDRQSLAIIFEYISICGRPAERGYWSLKGLARIDAARALAINRESAKKHACRRPARDRAELSPEKRLEKVAFRIINLPRVLGSPEKEYTMNSDELYRSQRSVQITVHAQIIVYVDAGGNHERGAPSPVPRTSHD
ncbi:hypothetical protein EVAR_65826_1 [Eumeta japonica]|uniref:Uncharacterized protein n=1 Tax=Eumeta variegata TaxID=151549 RepID=A0A4C1ZNN3_EUMVA|nr:hypothetical protein EVAR_65826_1 [Eumeta japonica]